MRRCSRCLSPFSGVPGRHSDRTQHSDGSWLTPDRCLRLQRVRSNDGVGVSDSEASTACLLTATAFQRSVTVINATDLLNGYSDVLSLRDVDLMIDSGKSSGSSGRTSPASRRSSASSSNSSRRATGESDRSVQYPISSSGNLTDRRDHSLFYDGQATNRQMCLSLHTSRWGWSPHDESLQSSRIDDLRVTIK